jgi:cell fate (sporulation/competence/biofilm development) regulator YlbF (YheA/YmcA/DUF963 family)
MVDKPSYRLCPFCGKRYKDLLAHFVVAHKIKNMNHLKEEIKKKKKNEKRRTEFRRYVNELKKKQEKGEISAADYRKLIVQWRKRQQ